MIQIQDWRYDKKIVVVDEKYRKHGVARLLMETAEKEAKKLGCKSVQLEYDKESEPFVLQWYQRLGYVVTDFGIDGHVLLVKKL